MNDTTVVVPMVDYFHVTTDPVLNLATSYTTVLPVIDAPIIAIDLVRVETKQESSAPPIAKAFARVGELARLEHNWDSYGGEPPILEALDAARDLLIKARRLGR